MDTNLSQGHRKRLRERFIKSGVSGFNDYELLELLLTYSISRKDVKPFAKNLLAKFGSISEVLDAELSELVKIDGINEVSAVLIRLLKELKTEYNIEKLKNLETIGSSADVYKFAMEKLAGCREEKFMTIYMDSKNRIIDCKINAEGTVTQARVYPRKILKEALALNASGLILVHNHPSGETNPSKQDIELTNSFKAVCETMDIRLVDHIIVGKTGYQSCIF